MSPGEQATITVSALDESPVSGHTLDVDGVPAILDANGPATITATTPGAIALVASAIDASGNLGVAQSRLAVRDAADTSAPAVSIATPLANASPEQTTLRDASTDIGASSVRAAQTEYDEDSRLVAVIDADGHCIQLVHDVQAREEASQVSAAYGGAGSYWM